jgi:hypothetical protein
VSSTQRTTSNKQLSHSSKSISTGLSRPFWGSPMFSVDINDALSPVTLLNSPIINYDTLGDSKGNHVTVTTAALTNSTSNTIIDSHMFETASSLSSPVTSCVRISGRSLLKKQSLYELSSEDEIDRRILDMAKKLAVPQQLPPLQADGSNNVNSGSGARTTDAPIESVLSPYCGWSCAETRDESVLFIDTARCAFQSPRYISRCADIILMLHPCYLFLLLCIFDAEHLYWKKLKKKSNCQDTTCICFRLPRTPSRAKPALTSIISTSIWC